MIKFSKDKVLLLHKLINFLLDGWMIVGCQHKSVNPFFHQTVNGGELGLKVEFHPSGDCCKSIVPQFF